MQKQEKYVRMKQKKVTRKLFGKESMLINKLWVAGQDGACW